MSSGSYWQAYVQCPFYRHDDGRQRITCEGVTDDSSLAMLFREKKGYLTQMTVFCCQNYTKCELYRLLMEKYEEDNV